MRDTIKVWSATACAGLLLEGWALYVVGPTAHQWRPARIVKDEPAAHALYDTMVRTLQDARSLSYTSTCTNPDDRASVYRIWLRKPDSFRVEQTNDSSQKTTTLLDDGRTFWVHWSGDRPALPLDTEATREDVRSNVYVRKATLGTSGSVRDEAALFGTALVGLIFDPSLFHGRPHPLWPCLDGIRSRGTDAIDGQECDVIEVGFLHAQRTWYLWLSREDHLPRRLKEVVRDAEECVTLEEWSGMTVSAEIPSEVFTWSPPQGGQRWDPPSREDSLVRRGQRVPDFELRAARGGRIRLSDYHGQGVWLYVWSAGSPQCRAEIGGLQQLHREYQDKGLALLGFNCTDNRRIARFFLRENGITLPSVLDSSEAAVRWMRKDFGNRTGIVPLNCIIDPQGQVVDTWFGPEQDPARALAALRDAGLGLAQ
jgi:peroxiredoxin